MVLEYSPKKLTERLNNILTEREISPKELSKRSGINDNLVYRILQNERTVSLENLHKICKALLTSPNYLMYGIEPKLLIYYDSIKE